MLTGSGGFATDVFAFGYGASPHVQPDPRDVPGDVLRASLARLCAHAQGFGYGHGLAGPQNAFKRFPRGAVFAPSWCHLRAMLTK